ncbi:Hypothetical predicted protein [Mytilus galloprovincialis]|uniref:SRCR domain-containing protein n=1 Tax=Mytilus galloprovincialis TaxID=29158 RepID=A0A8B6FLZ3_MYTGA|nr:Hypothetical predicted protein [Mytilus galloprovincialis]
MKMPRWESIPKADNNILNFSFWSITGGGSSRFTSIPTAKVLDRSSGTSLGNTVEDGTGIIWLDDMKCTGNELYLVDCSNAGWGEENCHHSEDVGIVCYSLNSNEG